MTGCSSYTQIEPGEVADYGKVRVTTTDGERDILYDPELSNNFMVHETVHVTINANGDLTADVTNTSVVCQ